MDSSGTGTMPERPKHLVPTSKVPLHTRDALSIFQP